MHCILLWCLAPVLQIRIRIDPLQTESRIRVRIRIMVISWIRIRINLQITSKNVWSMSLFEHFFKVLSFYLEASPSGSASKWLNSRYWLGLVFDWQCCAGYQVLKIRKNKKFSTTVIPALIQLSITRLPYPLLKFYKRKGTCYGIKTLENTIEIMRKFV